jgi:Tfp pilus assembly protein PilF
MPAPWIFTFYSFKGGVGRSLAAANVAYTLAGSGRHVLLIDMDLEAPGLSSFLDRNNELDPPRAPRQSDVLALLTELVTANRTGGDPETIVQNLPPISGFIRPVAAEKLAKLKPQLGELGRLDVLGLDDKRNYTDRLAALGLHGMPQDQLVSLSRLLRRYLKSSRFPHRPFWREKFQPPVQTPYDYIIVDSRTGLTEIGGLCVGPLADRLVVFTGLNDQNVHGTLMFLKEVGLTPAARPTDAEPWDDDDSPASTADLGTVGPKPTMIVASPVPAGEIEAKQKRLKEIESRLGVVPQQISYHPQMALLESIFVRDYPDEYLTSQYRNFTDRVQSLVGDNADYLVSQLAALFRKTETPQDWTRAKEIAIRLASLNPGSARAYLSILASHFTTDSPLDLSLRVNVLLSQNPATRTDALNNWGNALLEQARGNTGEAAEQLYAAATEKYAEVVKLNPEHAVALNNWANAISDQAKQRTGEHATLLYTAATEKYQEALRLNPSYSDALNNWGLALSDQAKGTTGERAEQLYFAAGEKYAEAIRIKPDHAEVLNNWATALADEARGKRGEKADQLYAACHEKYLQAVSLKPDYVDGFYNWGNALLAQGEGKTREAAKKLFAAAAEKYEKAVKLRPDDAAALNNWGTALSAVARGKRGEEALHLHAAASEKYAEAARLKPDDALVLNNWGAALMRQAILSLRGTGTEACANELLDSAQTKLLQAGYAGLYNLACLYAIRRDIAKVISTLTAEQNSGKPLNRPALESEPAFDFIRNDPDFTTFLATLPT